jgi:hypothetical protein
MRAFKGEHYGSSALRFREISQVHEGTFVEKFEIGFAELRVERRLDKDALVVCKSLAATQATSHTKGEVCCNSLKLEQS